MERELRSVSSFFFARNRPNNPLCFSFFSRLDAVLAILTLVGALPSGV